MLRIRVNLLERLECVNHDQSFECKAKTAKSESNAKNTRKWKGEKAYLYANNCTGDSEIGKYSFRYA